MIELNTLYHQMSYEDYSAQPGLRASHLHEIKRSPAHLKAAMDFPRPPTDAMALGTIIHSFLENGEKFMDTYVVEPEFIGKTKDGRESKSSGEARQLKKDWYASLKPGQVVVTSSQVDVIVGVSKTISESRVLKQLLKSNVREASLFVDDPMTGERLMCRPDMISSLGQAIDFKTCQNANEFRQEIFSDGPYRRFYILSAAHYNHCLKIAKICKQDQFIFVAIETNRPWGIKMYLMDAGHLDIGEQWRAHLTELYAKCRRQNYWPCYPDRIEHLEIPNWVHLPEEK